MRPLLRPFDRTADERLSVLRHWFVSESCFVSRMKSRVKARAETDTRKEKVPAEFSQQCVSVSSALS